MLIWWREWHPRFGFLGIKSDRARNLALSLASPGSPQVSGIRTFREVVPKCWSLSGLRHSKHFEALRGTLRAFENLEILPEDYERAAEHFNNCRRRGIQGSNTDFLICAVAERLRLPIFTTDQDFQRFAEHLPIELWAG